MDRNQLRQHLTALVPFNRHVGLEVTELEAGRAVARLIEAPTLVNHVGTFHAGALFTLADAASGAAMVGMYADRLGRTTMVVREADVAFLKPARGIVTAMAATLEDRASIDERLAREGRTEAVVEVWISDREGVGVARFRMVWHLRQS
jgi:uncharacterized protein (TIGR00369 family)